jgi:hypothetical protein
MSETEDIQQLANQYVSQTKRIKETAASLSALRKDLKSIDASLLEQMRAAGIMELTARGVTIQCTNKLNVLKK